MKRYYRTGNVQKYLFVLQDSTDVRIEGVTIRNAPLWNVRLQDCRRVWIRGINLFSDLERGVNSDGIDIVSTSDVLISDSIICAADDAIALKTMRFGRGDAPAGPAGGECRRQQLHPDLVVHADEYRNRDPRRYPARALLEHRRPQLQQGARHQRPGRRHGERRAAL